jgi:hypothetical protein
MISVQPAVLGLVATRDVLVRGPSAQPEVTSWRVQHLIHRLVDHAVQVVFVLPGVPGQRLHELRDPVLVDAERALYHDGGSRWCRWRRKGHQWGWRRGLGLATELIDHYFVAGAGFQTLLHLLRSQWRTNFLSSIYGDEVPPALDGRKIMGRYQPILSRNKRRASLPLLKLLTNAFISCWLS